MHFAFVFRATCRETPILVSRSVGFHYSYQDRSAGSAHFVGALGMYLIPVRGKECPSLGRALELRDSFRAGCSRVAGCCQMDFDCTPSEPVESSKNDVAYGLRPPGLRTDGLTSRLKADPESPVGVYLEELICTVSRCFQMRNNASLAHLMLMSRLPNLQTISTYVDLECMLYSVICPKDNCCLRRCVYVVSVEEVHVCVEDRRWKWKCSVVM